MLLETSQHISSENPQYQPTKHRKDDITVITNTRTNAPIFLNLVITLTSNYDREYAVVSFTVKLYTMHI